MAVKLTSKAKKPVHALQGADASLIPIAGIASIKISPVTYLLTGRSWRQYLLWIPSVIFE